MTTMINDKDDSLKDCSVQTYEMALIKTFIDGNEF